MGIPFKKISKAIRYGTLFQSLHRRVHRMGINIFPYYLVREQPSEVSLSEFKGNLEEYDFQFLSLQDTEEIRKTEIKRVGEDQFREWLKKGWKCMGVKHSGKVVAYNWIDLEECHYSGHRFRLKDNEAYLFNMYTLSLYRGKNIAAHLRNETYKALKDMGKNTFYSISEVFNRPSIKFKKKLNAKFIKLCLFIELFKKFRWNLTLKKYKV